MSCCENCGGLTLLQGTNGIGIVSITDNGDGTLTILYTDGNIYVTPDFTGPTGAAGNNGAGAYTGFWNFDTSTAINPAATFLRMNDAIANNVTKIYINKTDGNSLSKEEYLSGFSNSDTIGVRYGIITIFDLANINNYANFTLTNITDQGTYIELDVESSTSNEVFTANMDLGVYFTPSESPIRTKVQLLTNWNMDTTSTFSFAHGLTLANIVSVDVMIISDDATTRSPLNSFQISTGGMAGGIFQIDTTNVNLARLTGGIFDGADYNATGDRGYATIKYLK